MNISLFVCYYLRIDNIKKREELSLKLTDILKFDFLYYPLKFENELANNIIIDKGISKNKQLLDNLLALFVCILNKIPLFITGKAGYSKNLSFKLLYQSLKGDNFKNDFFNNFKNSSDLYFEYYQGSSTNNSNEIKNIIMRIDKNRNILQKLKKNKKNKIKDNIYIILFDNMEQIEKSEYDAFDSINIEIEKNKEISFIGFSDKILESSLMNKGINVSILEPDLNDLISTANSIGVSIYEEVEKNKKYKDYIKNLAISYYKYKEYLKKNYKSYYDFHGVRDFYYLIKSVSRKLKNNNIDAIESIERNFGGLEIKKGDNIESSSMLFKQIYFENIDSNEEENLNNYDVISCIKNNLEDDDSRYLLLITNKTKNDMLIKYIFKKLNLKYKLIIGSKLKKEQNTKYEYQRIWPIISSLEKGETIVLKDMDIIYPKLDDLFNNNYDNSGFTNIILEEKKERFIVNKNFRCVILLNKDEINEHRPSFLNRFEKYLISFGNLLTKKQNKIAKELYEELLDVTNNLEKKKNKKNIPFLININLEEIKCLLLDLSMRNSKIENNLENIYELLVPTFSQENILNLLFSKQQKKYINKERIIKIYQNNNYYNIFKLLEKVDKNKLIIYTFSPYYKDIFKENDSTIVKNQHFGDISKEKTIEITFDHSCTEDTLYNLFNSYYEEDECNLFIIHFKLKDIKYLKNTKYQIDMFHEENKENSKKIFLFIIHIENYYDIDNKIEKYHQYFFSLLSEYQQITIDNILNTENISVIDLFNKTNEELLLAKELFDINSIIIKNFYEHIIQMPYNEEVISIKDKLDNLLKNGISESISKKIILKVKDSENLLKKYLLEYSLIKEKDYDYISYFIDKIKKLISDNIKNIINEIVQKGYFNSNVFELELPSDIKKAVLSLIENCIYN